MNTELLDIIKDKIPEGMVRPDETDNWLYKSKEEKIAIIKELDLYNCTDDGIYAYIPIRDNRYDRRNFIYRYIEDSNVCVPNADYTEDNPSFGIIAYPMQYFIDNDLIDTPMAIVKILYDDIARVLTNCIRCSKVKVIR